MSYYDTSYPPSLWTGPPPPPGPTLVSINPTTAVVGDPMFPLVCTGTGFLAGDVIVIDGTDYATSVNDPTEVGTQFNPTTDGVYPVFVKRGSFTTTNRALTITTVEADPEPTDDPKPPPYTAVPVDK